MVKVKGFSRESFLHGYPLISPNLDVISYYNKRHGESQVI